MSIVKRVRIGNSHLSFNQKTGEDQPYIEDKKDLRETRFVGVNGVELPEGIVVGVEYKFLFSWAIAD